MSLKNRYCNYCGKSTWWWGARCLKCWRKLRSAWADRWHRTIALAIKK